MLKFDIVQLALWTSAVVSLVSGGYDSFMVVNDIHTDHTYYDHAESCGIHLEEKSYWAEYVCDPPWTMVEDAIHAMSRTGRDAKFVIWNGDNTPHVHDYSFFNRDLIMSYLRNTTNLFLQYFPNTPVYPVIGNHDWYPVNNPPPGPDPIYDDILEMWMPFINDEQAYDTFRMGGYYTKLMPEVGPNIRAVVLNAALWLYHNHVTYGMDDPGGQWVWLEQLLADMRERGEKAHLITHALPGRAERAWYYQGFYDQHNARFNYLVANFSDIILGIYAGHIHTNSFRLFYDQNSQPVGVGFVNPALAPRLLFGFPGAVPNNPGFRTYLYDSDTYELYDFEQYYFDVTKTKDHRTPHWKLMFKFKEEFGAANLSPREVETVLHKYYDTNKKYFERYYELNLLGVDPVEYVGPCDCQCRYMHLCAMRYIDKTEFFDCYYSTPCS